MSILFCKLLPLPLSARGDFRLAVRVFGFAAAGFETGVELALVAFPCPRGDCFVGFVFVGFVGVLGDGGGVGVCCFFLPFGGIFRTVLRVVSDTVCPLISLSLTVLAWFACTGVGVYPCRLSYGCCQGGLGRCYIRRTVCSLLLDAVLCHTACVSHRSPVDLCHLSAEWLLPNRFGAMRSTWWARPIVCTGGGYD